MFKPPVCGVLLLQPQETTQSSADPVASGLHLGTTAHAQGTAHPHGVRYPSIGWLGSVGNFLPSLIPCLGGGRGDSTPTLSLGFTLEINSTLRVLGRRERCLPFCFLSSRVSQSVPSSPVPPYHQRECPRPQPLHFLQPPFIPGAAVPEMGTKALGDHKKETAAISCCHLRVWSACPAPAQDILRKRTRAEWKGSQTISLSALQL